MVISGKVSPIIDYQAIGGGVCFKASDRRNGILTARLVLLVPAIRITVIPSLDNVIQLLNGGLHPQVVASIVGGEQIAC